MVPELSSPALLAVDLLSAGACPAVTPKNRLGSLRVRVRSPGWTDFKGPANFQRGGSVSLTHRLSGQRYSYLSFSGFCQLTLKCPFQKPLNLSNFPSADSVQEHAFRAEIAKK